MRHRLCWCLNDRRRGIFLFNLNCRKTKRLENELEGVEDGREEKYFDV